MPQRGRQLPGGQFRRAGHHHRLSPHRQLVIEGQQLADEHLGAGLVDQAGGQRRGHLRQPHHPGRQGQQPVGGARGQLQRGRDLISDELARGTIGTGPPRVQVRDRGELRGLLPGGVAPRRAQEPDQLVIVQPAQPVTQRGAGERGQLAARQHPVQHTPGRKPAPRLTRHVMNEPGIPRLRHLNAGHDGRVLIRVSARKPRQVILVFAI